MTPTCHRRISARSLKDQLMNTTPAAPSVIAGSVGGSRRRPLAVRALAALAAILAGIAGLGLASAPAMADDCPNATLRAQNNSEQLPDCRAYERVTPVFKEGYIPFPAAITDDGKLSYSANGNFADNELGASAIDGGNSYNAVRSSSGWASAALAPSGAVYNTSGSRALALAPDLSSSIWGMARVEQPVGVLDLYVRRPDGTFTRMGPTADPDVIPPTAPGGTSVPANSGSGQVGASDDLSHVVFNLAGQDVYPGILPDGSFNLYELVAGDPTPRPVGVNNAGQQIEPGCESSVGSRSQTTNRAMSTDGRVIFWTSGCDPNQLWARVGGTTTVAVSASQCTRAPGDPGGICNPSATAVFQGANANGTRVYFTTSQQLVNGDTDSTTDLYECDIPTGTLEPIGLANPCPDLREVSGAASDADVQGVTRISDDGSRVYFVATGVLAANHGANDASAVVGDDNLYVWQQDAAHPAGNTTFVGKLDPGDLSLWGTESSGSRMAQSTDDGRYLLLATYAPLIDHGPQADTDASQDIYRYDANSGTFTRLSTGADGEGGNAPNQDATFSAVSYRLVLPTNKGHAMTDDGATAVFMTTDALSPRDTNGGLDMYMWHDGQVWLLTSGRPTSDDILTVGRIAVWISPSGRDIYLQTSARLLPSDVDTVSDIYDARVDGGFDLSTPPPCTADACQGGRSAAPPAVQSASSSLTGQDGLPQVTPAFSVKALTVSQLGRIAATGKVSLSVMTNAPGTLSAKATTTIAKRPSTVGSAKRNVSKAGTVALSLTLSKKARAELKSKRKLTVKVLVSQDNVAISRTVSLKLTQPKAAKKTRKKSSPTTSRHVATKGGRS